MLRISTPKLEAVIGPLGEEMIRADLPPADTSRWVARRKAEVVAAVNGGLLSVGEACDRYQLSLEELVSWQRAVDRDGLPGLRVRSVQQNRKGEGREARRLG